MDPIAEYQSRRSHATTQRLRDASTAGSAPLWKHAFVSARCTANEPDVLEEGVSPSCGAPPPAGGMGMGITCSTLVCGLSVIVLVALLLKMLMHKKRYNHHLRHY